MAPTRFTPERDWQLKQQSVGDRCGYLLKSEQWSDCCFIVGTEANEKRYKAHKIILAMSSPVFQAMFFGGTAEHEPIPILDVQPDSFKILLDYIYTDKINITTFDQACEVCYAAKKYMLPHLVEQCTQRIFEDLYASNACKAYEFAKLFEEPILMQRSLEIIYNETEAVLADPSFEDVELSTLLLVFDSSTLNISSERDLFNALMRWASKECSRKGLQITSPNLREVIGTALQKIHFLTLTPLQFAEGPADAPLLTRDESLSILVNISNPRTPSTKFPMPEGFSKVVEPRTRFRYSSNDHPKPSKRCFYQRDLKFYCQKPILGKALQLSNGHTDCTTAFSVDQNVTIIGFEFLAQHNDSPVKTYTELLYAHLLDPEGSRLTYTHFSCRAEHNYKLEILFNKPVCITRNKVYRIAVVLNSPGWYEMPVNNSGTVSANTVGTTFTFYHDGSDDRSIVLSIIFAHDSHYSGIVEILNNN